MIMNAMLLACVFVDGCRKQLLKHRDENLTRKGNTTTHNDDECEVNIINVTFVL